MLGRIKPQILSRLPRNQLRRSLKGTWGLSAPRYWLALGAALWGLIAMGQTPGPGQAPAQPAGSPPGRAPPAAQPPPVEAPDDEFIEFLGEDDHGDSAWWEFLNKTPPGSQSPAPPQSPKQ
jgi:hypothetical protein